VRQDGGYEMVALKKDDIAVSAVQSRLLAVDPRSPASGLKTNLDHLLDQLDAVNKYFGRKDLVAFHQFLLQGWDRWTRSEMEKVALNLDGPEVMAIATKAREYGCYVAFGGYFRDKDWPGHLIDMMVLVSPDSALSAHPVIAKHWRARHVRNEVDGADYFTTCVYDVLDAYREMYGEDAVLGVARTPIGNIAMTSLFREPELTRALTLKGAEILVRSGLGGYTFEEGVLMSRVNRNFTLFISNALSPGNKAYFPDNGFLGRTAIFDTRGRVLADSDKHETSVNATIELARHRRRPRIADVPWELYAPVFSTYTPRFPANLYAEGLPASLEDAAALVQKKKRW
jgi:predicted amidohydrolase